MPNVSAHSPMTYLTNVSPLLQACGDGNHQYNPDGTVSSTSTGTGCSCTDPSYGYQTKCSLQSGTKNTGRFHCTFGDIGTGVINPSTGGPFSSQSNLAYQIKPNDGVPTTFATPTGPSSTVTGGPTNLYPSSLLFCSNPTTPGKAAPNLPTNNITPGTSGQGLNTTNWNKAHPNTSKTPQTNIGFE
jgi:hypothetical protein